MKAAAMLAIPLVAGCVSFSEDGGFGNVEKAAAERGVEGAKWVRAEDDANSVAARVGELLAAPLSADDAVRVALLNNPGLQARYAVALRDFSVMMRDLEAYLQAQPDEVIRQVLDRTGYREMLRSGKTEEDQQRLANVEELITAASQFAALDNRATIAEFLENITLSSDVDGYNEQQDSVSIMTMHSAKGLEFPVVFLAAVE